MSSGSSSGRGSDGICPSRPTTDRDHHDPAPQRLCDLLANVVGLAACRLCAQQIDPARANDGDQHVAGVERLGHLLIEALAGQGDRRHP